LGDTILNFVIKVRPSGTFRKFEEGEAFSGGSQPGGGS